MFTSKIISIGDELLIGQVVNSNASFIGERMKSTGIPVKKVITIGDTENELLDELKDSLINYAVTIITGGLGPTHDDITKPCLVKFFEDELITDTKVLEHCRQIFRNRGIEMPLVNEEQALVPKNSKIIWNENGTAPGIWIEKENKMFVSLPGVPFEMKAMMDNSVIPLLKKKFSGKINYFLKSKTILTSGIGESILSNMIGDVKIIIGSDKLAFLPSAIGVRLRIDVKGENEKEADNKLKNISDILYEKIGEYIFGEGDDLLEDVVGKILTEKKLKLAVAESCSGGLLASRITDISGSSNYFLGGICAYSNEVKINLLNVKKETIEKYGAVSEETAKEMADNVRIKFNSDIGISTTGIAGPTGATETKPVGLVYIGFSFRNKLFANKYLFGNNRDRNKQRSVQEALNLIRRNI